MCPLDSWWPQFSPWGGFATKASGFKKVKRDLMVCCQKGVVLVYCVHTKLPMVWAVSVLRTVITLHRMWLL